MNSFATLIRNATQKARQHEEQRPAREQAARARKDAGRYTLAEAAAELVQAVGGNAAAGIYRALAKAARDGHLVTYQLGSLVPADLSTWKGDMDAQEAKATDLNAWLNKDVPDITWRFQAKNATEQTSKPVSRYAHQDAEILRVLKELELDPDNLPKAAPGKPGPKASVRKKLTDSLWTDEVFRKAWARFLRSKKCQ